MTTRGTADIVFCLDASESMRPCLDGVKKHVGDFVKGLGVGVGNQSQWDLRFDLVAHHVWDGCEHRSIFEADLWKALYKQGGQSRLFSQDRSVFTDALARVDPQGDEAALLALDFALDFPWRPAASCHRVVVQMTDEAFETGIFLEQQRPVLPRLLDKIEKLGVLLFIVGPDCREFQELATVDRSTFMAVDSAGDGLRTVDFGKVLAGMGKSVSVSRLQKREEPVDRGLFGQTGWADHRGWPLP